MKRTRFQCTALVDKEKIQTLSYHWHRTAQKDKRNVVNYKIEHTTFENYPYSLHYLSIKLALGRAACSTARHGTARAEPWAVLSHIIRWESDALTSILKGAIRTFKPRQGTT